MKLATFIWQILKSGGLLALWLIAVWAMWRSHQLDPFDPTLQGTDRYGHNGEGDFKTFFIITLVELAVLYIVLRPWSFRRSFGRLLVVLVLFMPWTFLSMLASMHAGSIVSLHWLWLVAVDAVLFVCAVVASVGTFLEARRKRATLEHPAQHTPQ